MTHLPISTPSAAPGARSSSLPPPPFPRLSLQHRSRETKRAAPLPKRLAAAALCLASLFLATSPARAQHKALAQATRKKAAPPAPVTPAPPQAPSQPAEQPVPAPAPTPPPPDALGRSTPYGTVIGFLRAAEAQDYARAVNYLDTKLPEEQAERLALQLKALFDLPTTNAKIETISRDAAGDTSDALRTARDKVGEVSTPSGHVALLLDRVDRPDEPNVWLFSQETLARVPAAYTSTQGEHKNIASYFPAWTSRIRILSIPLWRWALVAVAILIALAIARLLARLLLWGVRRALRPRMTVAIEGAILKLNGPTFGLTLALIMRISADYAITALGRHYWIVAAIIAGIVAFASLLMRLTDIVTAFLIRRLFQRHQIERITAVGLVARLLKILIVIIFVIVLLTLAGVNVSAVFAGLGIGGIALALAAQKTLADLFGGISIVMRGAVRVNDYCTVAGQTGTIEEIGISSLRLRTLDRSSISIPNAKVAEMELINFTMRDQFWVHQIFTLRFDTPHATLRKVLEQITDLLQHRPDIDENTARIRIIQLTPAGPQIELFAYYRRPGGIYETFLIEQEQIILEILRIVEENGTSLTSPIGIVRLDGEQPRHIPNS